MTVYKIETRYVDRGGPNHTVLVRRPTESTIAIGVGNGHTLAEAVASALREVRLRRRVGQFRKGAVRASDQTAREIVALIDSGDHAAARALYGEVYEAQGSSLCTGRWCQRVRRALGESFAMVRVLGVVGMYRRSQAPERSLAPRT